MFCFGCKVRLLGFFSGIKIPKVDFLARYNYARTKLVFVLSPLNAENSSFVVFMGRSLVMQVLAHRGFTKICYAIISRIAVDVVNELCWKAPVHIQPSKAMGLVTGVPDGDVSAAFGATRSSNITSLSSTARYAPNKLSVFRVVIQQLTKTLGGQFFFYNTASHDDSFKVGLVRARVAVQTPHRLVQFTGVVA